MSTTNDKATVLQLVPERLPRKSSAHASRCTTTRRP